MQWSYGDPIIVCRSIQCLYGDPIIVCRSIQCLYGDPIIVCRSIQCLYGDPIIVGRSTYHIHKDLRPFPACSNDGSFSDLAKSTTGYSERDVSNKMTSFAVAGLRPGELYGLCVKTKGSRQSKKKELGKFEPPPPLELWKTVKNIFCSEKYVAKKKFTKLRKEGLTLPPSPLRIFMLTYFFNWCDPKTGDRITRTPIQETVLTKPEKVIDR